MEQLFNKITEITGDHYKTARIFLALKDYVYEHEAMVGIDENGEYDYIVDSKDLDFGGYVLDHFDDEEQWSKILP